MHTFDQIIGYESQKNELKTICDILKNPGNYNALGVRPPHALMIYGDPGLGKTMMAKALIDESGRSCFCCKKSKGKTDFNQDIKETFENASANAPSIVFLDDMDKFAEDNLQSDSNKEEFATIQSCMEDVSDKDVFILATANDIYNLPESLMRPGRFGKKMYVGLPSVDDFLKIATRFLDDIKTKENDLPKYVTRLIGGKSPALLKEVINEAGISAAFRGDSYITKKDVTQAVLNVVYNMREQCFSAAPNINKEKQRLVAYHEAGHAVMAMILGRPISIISTISSGELGGVCLLSSEKKEQETLKDVEKEILTLLGGRASSEVLLGEKDRGSIGDFERATKILRSSCEKELMFGFEFGYDLRHWDERGSNTRKDIICDKIYALMSDYYKSACKIIEENKTLVSTIAEELLRKDYLTFEDIECLLA